MHVSGVGEGGIIRQMKRQMGLRGRQVLGVRT